MDRLTMMAEAAAATWGIWLFIAGLTALAVWLAYACEPRPDRCRCGHDEGTHFRGTGACLHSTDAQVWACACDEYRPRRPETCKITVEWDGHFIGRQSCHTHGVWWDDDGPCPAATPRLADDYTGPADPNEPTLGDKS